MAKRHCEDWLKSFISYTSFGEAPLKMLFWTGVSTIAGALRRRVWLDQKYFLWIPNFYVVFVAPPGIVSKSTTANIGMNLLRKLSYIKFGPDVITWQALVKSLAEATEAVVDTRTGEFSSMSAVTFCSDELGNLLNPQDRDLVDALVTLWDGKQGVFRKETKMSGKDAIENPFVNIIGCTTPSWISGNFPEYLLGGGFTSRCVFIYADRKRQYVPYVDEVVPANFEESRAKLVHDLEIISTLYGEYEIHPLARAWGKEWYARHWKRRPESVGSEQFDGYVARKQTHMHKLSLVLAASKSDELVVTVRDLQEAEAMITAIEEDMPKVFSRIGQNDITRGSQEIVSCVESYPGVTYSQLYKRLFRTLAFRDFVEALSGSVNSGQVWARQVGNEMCYYPTRKGPTDEQQQTPGTS